MPVEQLYSGFAGQTLENSPIRTNRYYPSHASFQPMPYAKAISEFKRQFIAAAIEDLSNHSQVVNYKNLATLLDESRYLEKQVGEIGLKPFLSHYYTELRGRRELDPKQIESYTPWKSIDSKFLDDQDIFEHPNLNPDLRVSAIAGKIIKEAQSSGDYNLKEAIDRFRALYVASVVKRITEARYTRTLAEPKAQAARYLKVSARTIDRMVDEAVKLGYAKIAKVQDPDTKYTYELLVLENQRKDAFSGIEQRIDKVA